jgi:hypothetical protein
MIGLLEKLRTDADARHREYADQSAEYRARGARYDVMVNRHDRAVTRATVIQWMVGILVFGIAAIVYVANRSDR